MVHIGQFTAEILIKCPHCKKCALIRSTEYSSEAKEWTSDCFCPQCSKSWQFHPGGHAINDSRPFLYLPLWLQTHCRGNVLWAFNQEHLDFLEAYVSQRLRKRPVNSNRSLQSRLPRWILSSKNRDAVQKAIRRLRANLLRN